MDGSYTAIVASDVVLDTQPFSWVQSEPESSANNTADNLQFERLEDLDTLVITKTEAGFDTACIAQLRQKILDAAAGRLGRLKFIVFDFAHVGTSDPICGENFDALVTEAANLILQAPIVLVANARAHMTGVDLEFALACSMLIGETGARFSFAADPIVCMGTYGFLAQKLGFVRAERLMEGGETLDAQQMHDLLLLKTVSEDRGGIAGIRQFLLPTSRRHNSCYGIYRAHRMASPAVRESRRAAI